MRQRRLVLLMFLVSVLVIVIVQCKQVQHDDLRGVAYAGSATCVKCHKDISSSYAHNAHFKTSKITEGDSSNTQRSSIADLLKLPTSEFIFNTGTRVGIEKRNGGLYQVAYINGKEVKAERTDVVFGSGHRAFTFGFWFGDQMMQMPLNYLTQEHQWVNSPGFPEDQVYFGRPIISRCLECHSSYIEKKQVSSTQLNPEESFVKGSMIAGIDCERCHGPAAEHVEFHLDNPEEKRPSHMIKFKELPLSRRIDMCGICHSGIQMQNDRSNFAFQPGDTLRSLPQYNTYNGGEPDVHGNQMQLLKSSPCFLIGKADCVSCHDVHEDQPQSLALYSKKCITCHQSDPHPKIKGQDAALLKQNCIDCHMPEKSSSAIGFQKSNSKEKFPYKVRTHRIAIYADLVK
jgi:3D (Asp-Asp-Asp) domain-containing protein